MTVEFSGLDPATKADGDFVVFDEIGAHECTKCGHAYIKPCYGKDSECKNRRAK